MDRENDLQQAALLRSVTHDLRTPLAAIRAVISDMYAGADYDARTKAELLETVLDEVDRLDRLVANLLSMSRIDAGMMQPRAAALDAEELVRHRIRQLSSLLREHTVTVDVPDDIPWVEGDYGQLEQVVTNLIGNAVRHAPAGTPIEITGRAVPAPDADGDRGDGLGFVAVAVIDHGPGIDPALESTIFDPFVHGEGTRSTGLGLTISRAIVENHGGTIGVSTTPGGGATVTFTLPAAAARGLPDEQ